MPSSERPSPVLIYRSENTDPIPLIMAPLDTLVIHPSDSQSPLSLLSGELVDTSYSAVFDWPPSGKVSEHTPTVVWMGNSSVKRTLTRTEIEVFIDCVKGLTLAQSGIKRSAPRPTQSSRLARGIEKLSAKNTAHAALKAIALGYDLEVRRNPGETTIGLPQRRRQVLCLLAQGLEYADIAGVLAISEGTAGVHGQRLYHAIGARKRAAVVRRAIELGLFVWPLPVAD